MVRVSGEAAVGGGPRVEPGDYQFIMQEARLAKCPWNENEEGFEIDCIVVASSVEGMEDRELNRQYVGANKLFKFAAAFNLTNSLTGKAFTLDDLKAIDDAVKNKQPVEEYDFDLRDGQGLQFQADVVMGKPSKTNGQCYPQLGFKIRPAAEVVAPTDDGEEVK